MTIDEILERADAQIASSHAHIVRSMITLGLDMDRFEPLQAYAASEGSDHESAEACWAEIERCLGVIAGVE